MNFKSTLFLGMILAFNLNQASISNFQEDTQIKNLARIEQTQTNYDIQEREVLPCALSQNLQITSKDQNYFTSLPDEVLFLIFEKSFSNLESGLKNRNSLVRTCKRFEKIGEDEELYGFLPFYSLNFKFYRFSKELQEKLYQNIQNIHDLGSEYSLIKIFTNFKNIKNYKFLGINKNQNSKHSLFYLEEDLTVLNHQSEGSASVEKIDIQNTYLNIDGSSISSPSMGFAMYPIVKIKPVNKTLFLNLKELKLTKCRIGTKELEYVADFIKNKKYLKILDLSYNDIKLEDLKLLDSDTISQLESLDLRFNQKNLYRNFKNLSVSFTYLNTLLNNDILLLSNDGCPVGSSIPKLLAAGLNYSF